MITVRRAQKKDADKTIKLLSEVLELHAKLRPDIFISGRTKYSPTRAKGASKISWGCHSTANTAPANSRPSQAPREKVRIMHTHITPQQAR